MQKNVKLLLSKILKLFSISRLRSLFFNRDWGLVMGYGIGVGGMKVGFGATTGTFRAKG